MSADRNHSDIGTGLFCLPIFMGGSLQYFADVRAAHRTSAAEAEASGGPGVPLSPPSPRAGAAAAIRDGEGR